MSFSKSPFSFIAGSGLGSSLSSYSQLGSLIPGTTFGSNNINCQVNLVNGNLMLQDKAFTFTDCGQEIPFSYIYNSQDNQPFF